MEPVVKLERINVYTCNRCSRATTNQDDLNGHVCHHEGVTGRVEDEESSELHTQESEKGLKPYQCSDCFEIFSSERDLRLHELKHLQKVLFASRYKNPKYDNDHLEKPYKCKECGISYVAQSTLEMHSVVHKPYPHVCFCGIRYYSIDDLKSHKKLVHPIDTSEKSVESMTENTTNEWKVGPRLKAELKLRSKTKTKRRKNTSKENIKIKKIGNKFECHICKKLFKAKSNVQKHQLVHTGEKPYKCEICNKAFTQKPARDMHLLKHTGVKNFDCEYCQKKFYTKDALNRHILIHTKEKPYECEHCGKEFSDPSARKRHIRIHTGEKPYCCPYCPMKFSDVSGLRMHKMRHDGTKNYTCKVCNKAFYVKSDVEKHMVKHTQERKFQCNECLNYYVSKGNLILHLKLKHEQVKNFECTQCSRKFVSKQAQVTHVLKIHNNAKNYKCKVCRKWFFARYELRKHKRTHMPWLYYECDYCFKRYQTKSRLVLHMLENHKGIKCEVCLRYFTSNSELEMHKQCFCKGPKVIQEKKSLKGQPKKYECDDCCKKFGSKPRLLEHCVNFHGSGNDKYICDYCNKEFKLRNFLVYHIRKAH